MMAHTDRITLRNISLSAPLSHHDPFSRQTPKPQPMLITYTAFTNIVSAAATDDVSKTLDYGKIYKAIHAELTEPCAGRVYTDAKSVAGFVRAAAQSAIHSGGMDAPAKVEVEVRMPKAFATGGEMTYWRSFVPSVHDTEEQKLEGRAEVEERIMINNLQCSTIIGVNPHEKIQRQTVVMDLEARHKLDLLPEESDCDRILKHSQDIVSYLHQRITGSSFLTVEALATFIARLVVMKYGLQEVTVGVEKPYAIAAVEGAGVKITRNLAFFAEKGIWEQEGAMT